MSGQAAALGEVVGERAPARTRRRVLRAVLWAFAGAGLVVGGVLTAAGLVQGGGYFGTGDQPLTTDSAAMVTREIDVEQRAPTDPQNDPGDLSRVRIRVESADPERPAFVGIARRSDVERYLSGVAHDEMLTFALDPFRVTWERHPGAESAPPPADQSIWVAKSTATGPGTAELQWDKSLGEWMVVAMNSDGTPGMDLQADVGLRFGFLLPSGIGLLGASLVLSGVLVLTRSARSTLVRGVDDVPSSARPLPRRLRSALVGEAHRPVDD